MLKARELSVRRNGIDVLSGIDLTLAPGQVLGVLGPNGAGKSSLIAALSGELPAGRGDVELDGRPLASWPDVPRARRLAVLPQTSTLAFGFRVGEIVAMGRIPHSTGMFRDASIVEQCLKAADIGHLADRNYLTLSGGERQRVQWARVLAQLWPGEAGQVLLLDEPTAVLDPAHQHDVLRTVRYMADQGVAVIVVMHDLNLAARYCDRLLFLKQGRIYIEGDVADVMTADSIQAVFDLETLVIPHPQLGFPLIAAR